MAGATMSVVCRIKRNFGLFFFVSGFLFVLSGCAPDDGEPRELFAGDGTVEALKRLFVPSAYWQKKLVALRGAVEADQMAFKERRQRYHALLQVRRANIKAAMDRAKQEGTDPHAARRAVIHAARMAMDPVRDEARRSGKRLRRSMALLVQAEATAQRSP